MNKEIHGFNFKTLGSLEWSDTSDNLSVSNEGIRDFISDKIAASYSESDIKKAAESNKRIEEVLKIDLRRNVKEPIVFLNEKESVLRFYTKKGRIISSFPVELENQAKNIDTLEAVISKLSNNISQMDVNVGEYEVLEYINDSELMPLFNKVSMLSFLGGVYINYIQEKRIDNVKVADTFYGKKVKTKKKSLVLSWLKGLLTGTVINAFPANSFWTYLRYATKRQLQLSPTTVSGTSLAILTVSALRSFKDTKKNVQETERYNKMVEKNFFNIVDASQIEPHEFQRLSNNLLTSSNKLLDTIAVFTEIDAKYKESNNRLLRDILRQTRILSTIGLKVLKVQGAYYKAILK